MSYRIQITAVQAVTCVGLTAATTTAAVRAGISRVSSHELFLDEVGNPLSVALVPDDDSFADPFDRMGPAAVRTLRTLIQSFDPTHDRGRPCHLLLGGAHPDRSDVLYEAPDDLLPVALASELSRLFGAPTVEVFSQGNASAMHALQAAAHILGHDSRAVCVVGAVDSLLGEELLERLEEEGRLKSEGEVSPHGLSPGEAAGFLVVEAAGAQSVRPPLATVEGIAIGEEPHPYYAEEPSLGEGLTDVCRRALLDARVEAADIDAVLIDLDGEHHRANEWAYTEVRCLGPRTPRRRLVHPASSYGSVGAASGVLLAALVSTARGWLDGVDLSLTSDDDGPRGAAVLRRQWKGQ